MSFFAVRNSQELEKHWSSCEWREGDKERCLSRPGRCRPGRGQGTEGDWNSPIAQIPSWPPENSLRVLERRKERRVSHIQKAACWLSSLALACASGMAFLCVVLPDNSLFRTNSGFGSVCTATVPHVALIFPKFNMIQTGFKTCRLSDTICNSPCRKILSIHHPQGKPAPLIPSALQPSYLIFR